MSCELSACRDHQQDSSAEGWTSCTPTALTMNGCMSRPQAMAVLGMADPETGFNCKAIF
ncbi:hypothetical protein SynROS8604_00542 [Synechococcus sp. ROS8604]|nr:hypothetical protein SynROS8604_00542 [Synechococcus sp. ROS8604]